MEEKQKKKDRKEKKVFVEPELVKYEGKLDEVTTGIPAGSRQ